MWFWWLKRKKEKRIKKDETKMNCKSEPNCPLFSDDCLSELRYVQDEIKRLNNRIKNLQNKYFPMVYWWIVTCISCYPRYLEIYLETSSNHLCRGEIEGVMGSVIRQLQSHLFSNGVDRQQFDVEQFCEEMKDLFVTDKRISELQERVFELKKSENNLKKILGII